MIYLNLGCGATRPQDMLWVNIDNLHAIFPNPCPERKNMDAEPNYLNADLNNGIPFEDSSIDGVFSSHMIEHFDCFNTVKFLKECLRVLKPNGVLRLSVPDPEIFHRRTVNNEKDWGEPYPENMSFMEHALFFVMDSPGGHQQLVGKDSLFCYLWMAGFRNYSVSAYQQSTSPRLAELDNRPMFSLFVEAVK